MVSRPQREHTELEEELHEIAHIDYDRVAIVSAPVRGPCLPGAECSADRQPFRGRFVRRCPGVRNGVGHHFNWGLDSILWREDWTVASRQTHCERARVRKGCVVGTCEQADDARGQYTAPRSSPLFGAAGCCWRRGKGALASQCPRESFPHPRAESAVVVRFGTPHGQGLCASLIGHLP